jgi:hypothetical protein
MTSKRLNPNSVDSLSSQESVHIKCIAYILAVGSSNPFVGELLVT